MVILHCSDARYHQSLLTPRLMCQGISHLKVKQLQCTQVEHPKNRQQSQTPHSQFHSEPLWIPTGLRKISVGAGSEESQPKPYVCRTGETQLEQSGLVAQDVVTQSGQQ